MADAGSPPKLDKDVVLRGLKVHDAEGNLSGSLLDSTRPTRSRTMRLGERDDVAQENDGIKEFFTRMRETRTEDTARTWGMLGIAALCAAAVGSVGTFARVSRNSLASPASKAIMAAQAKEAASSGLMTVAAMEREVEKAAIRARLAQLQANQREKHPLWFPAE